MRLLRVTQLYCGESGPLCVFFPSVFVRFTSVIVFKNRELLKSLNPAMCNIQLNNGNWKLGGTGKWGFVCV